MGFHGSASVSESRAKTDSVSFVDKHYFLIRRLHSLSGLVPVGVFLVMHLLTNASVLVGPDEFQKSVDRIHALGPLLIPVEVVFIFLPLLFHALVGFQIALTASPNAQQYRYGSNVRYTLQRVSGYIVFLFILYHLWHMHWVGKPLAGGKFDPHDAAATAATAIRASVWIAPVYAVGIIASVFHLANGIWTALITWGITIRPASQRTAGYVCAAFGVILGLIGLGALSGFRTLDPGSGIEQPGRSQHAGVGGR
jgi:succinate dehydrogenase / fumarate reductase cytochrome b subunit